MTADELLPMLALGFAILVQTAVISFLLGRLSQRVVSVETRLGEQDTKLDARVADQSLLIKAVAKLEVEMAHSNKSMDTIAREMTGVHRQLGNLAMNRVGHGGEL